MIGQLQGKDLGEFLIVSSCMLRDDAFLDDVTVSDVEKALGVPVLVSKDVYKRQIIQCFCHWCQAVGCARCSRDDFIFFRQCLFINAVNDCRPVSYTHLDVYKRQTRS